jgi:hypothetical protein
VADERGGAVVPPIRPTPGLARLALAHFLDRALGARLQEIPRDRSARLEVFHDYTLLIRYVRSLQDSDGLLQELAMTALDLTTGTLRLHSNRPFAFAIAYRPESPNQPPDAFVAELVSMLVTDDLAEANGNE